ncbi:ATP-binding protein [Paenibacillus sp. CMAA1364]
MPLLSIFIIVASVLLHKPTHVTYMIITGLMLNVSVTMSYKWKWLRFLQIIFLGLFHYSSQLNWCVLIYYIVLINLIEDKKSFRNTAPIGLFVFLQYTLIRFTYVPATTYTIFGSVFDLFSSLVVVIIFHHIIRIDSDRRELTKQNEYLSNYDTITGFYNYLGYFQKVQQMIDKKQQFLFVLFDINNFKSLKIMGSIPTNDILIGIALALEERFPNYIAGCRYSGDRFSLMLLPDETIDDLHTFEELGLHTTYSITRFPEEALDFQQLMQKGEERIFQLREDYWQKRHEEQLRSGKMKMVGELAAGMAHEIRNPLTSIKGFIQLSKRSGYNIEPWYDVIMSEITRVGELTAEFLQFSKPHANQKKSEMMTQCLSRVYSLCESEAASCGHTIEMEATDSSIFVLMDRDKIIQVLINLIRNAFQAIEQGGHIQLKLHREEGMAVIQVCDNGQGIPIHDMDKIFEPFYTTKVEGTGLGLSLCQKIIQEHHGKISVESILAVGTVFTVKLPIYAGD